MKPGSAKAWLRAKRARDWLVAKTAFAVMGALRLLPADAGLGFADRAGRLLGPLAASRHRIAIDNLSKAFPEKDAAWIRETAKRNWGQMGRVAAEYVFLDDLFDYDIDRPGAGRIEVAGAEIFEALKTSGRPAILFTAHLGCFELLPVAAAAYGLEVTAMFRPPNNRYIASRVLSARRTKGGHLVPSKAGATWALATKLGENGKIGVLVDQKFKRGAPTSFFGRPCRTNPLLPKLARQFDADIYPARAVRLPGNRYRLELQPRVDLPRNAEGAIDVAASCQRLNDVVEGWVREHPEQWMWFHRRWSK
jgi:Kdo2-lipid IVA lauroyltransferase/acyltransferase